MAHGTNRINVCYNCNQYILVSRFSSNPICPNCNKESKQTTKQELKHHFNLGFFYNFVLEFDHWEKIE